MGIHFICKSLWGEIYLNNIESFVLMFSVYTTFTCVNRVIPYYFIVFDAIANILKFQFVIITSI